MEQILCHIFGDYFLQSDWMALNKSKKTYPCLVHCLFYTLPFILLTQEWQALLIIFSSHFVLDRWHFILKRLIWFKNHFGPTMKYPPYSYCDSTGYFDDSPYNTLDWKDLPPHPFNESIPVYGKPRHFFITIWLYIVTDNLFHLTINYFAIKYFGS